MKELNKIYQGNSLELIKELEVEPDLIVLSPPDVNETSYNISQYREFLRSIYSDCANKLKSSGIIASITTNTKRDGSIYTKSIDITNILRDQCQLNLFNYKIWAKSLSINLFIQTYAHMLFFEKGRGKIKNKNKEFLPDVWVLECEKINGYPSKDAFSLELIKRIIETFTNEGSLILDPFCGSGRSLKIAKQLKRNYIGFEIDAGFIGIAEKFIGED